MKAKPISNPNIPDDLSGVQYEIIMIVSHLYTALEHISRHDAKYLTDAGRANIRRTQSEIQKLRLKLLDHFKSR